MVDTKTTAAIGFLLTKLLSPGSFDGRLEGGTLPFLPLQKSEKYQKINRMTLEVPELLFM